MNRAMARVPTLGKAVGHGEDGAQEISGIVQELEEQFKRLVA